MCRFMVLICDNSELMWLFVVDNKSLYKFGWINSVKGLGKLCLLMTYLGLLN